MFFLEKEILLWKLRGESRLAIVSTTNVETILVSSKSNSTTFVGVLDCTILRHLVYIITRHKKLAVLVLNQTGNSLCSKSIFLVIFSREHLGQIFYQGNPKRESNLSVSAFYLIFFWNPFILCMRRKKNIYSSLYICNLLIRSESRSQEGLMLKPLVAKCEGWRSWEINSTVICGFRAQTVTTVVGQAKWDVSIVEASLMIVPVHIVCSTLG